MRESCVSYQLLVPLFALFLLSNCSRSSIDPALLSTIPETVDYNFHVKPILSDRCFTCHGPDENTLEAGLRLDTEDGPFAKLESGERAVVPGRPGSSALISRIWHDDPDEVMPPPASNLTLTDYEKAVLQRWVEQGASWEPHWAFITPEKPALPGSDIASGSVNGIDFFVRARLSREGFEPTQEATKEQLIRRLAFDLTGLPPSIEEIDTFLSDNTEDAYEKLVDRFLAKDAFGERMASEWLDIARYADTGGYQSDRLRRMWPWRDWVIDAFNKNLPYNDFITWQLAGDLLPNATQEQMLATAFNRNHRQTEEGGSIEEEFRTEYVADRTNTTATAFMGLTMECARCHDHKYDPLSQKEYFQLFAFFNNIDESGQTSFFTDAVPVPTMILTEPENLDALKKAQTLIAEKEQALADYIESSKNNYESWFSRLQSTPIDAARIKGLVGHAPFERISDESSPNIVNPSHAGKTVFDPQIVAGKTGNAIQFDGENGIEFKDAGAFERTEPFSLSFWMFATEWNETNALVHRTKAVADAGSRGYEVSLQNNKLMAGLAHMWPENALRVVMEDSLSLDEWIHVAMTYDGSSEAKGLKLYVNGAEAKTQIVRDNLTRNISYERTEVNLTVGYRFRDAGFKDGQVDELKIYDRELTAFEIAALSGADTFASLIGKSTTQLAPADKDALAAYHRSHHDAQYAALLEELEALRATENELIMPMQEMMVMREMEERRPTHLLIRGEYNNKGALVEPGTPAAMLPFAEDLPPNRLGLSQWLTDPDHPLTARVAVNRYWQLLFGQGLVSTPEDFGSQGALPSHPALLDWLAVTFVESGWDVKDLLKTIVMSATYRQASEGTEALISADPANVLLARGPKRRLAAEMIRDNALAVSGLLVDQKGGPPVKPYQPDGLWKEKSGKQYIPDTGDGLYRRSLYTFWRRTSPPPSMITFDATRRNTCAVRRQQTSTPMQALVLLNDPQFVEASRVLAEQLIESEESLDVRIQHAFRTLTSRLPTDDELEILKQTYNDQFLHFAEHPNDAEALLSVGDKAPDPDFNPQELAASTILVNTIMNFDAAIINR